jgi:UDP-glucose 4-epimerase
MNVLVTGGAGFIGSHLCASLLDRNHSVYCVDNLYLGRLENIRELLPNKRFHFFKFDMLDRRKLSSVLKKHGIEMVFHLAANSDIQAGSVNHEIDLNLNFKTTYTLLETMLEANVKNLFFASTSAIFGETPEMLHEKFGPLAPISFYGASKLASEAYISVFANNYSFKAWILRFPNVIGEHATHGALYDFITRLKKDPSKLTVLGNGKQTKPYMYVKDLVAAILMVWEKAQENYNVFHVGNVDLTSVREIVGIVVEEMGLSGIPIEYTGGDRGWVGDVPFFNYDITKIKSIGWMPKYNSTEAVRIAVRKILGKE